MVDVISTFQEDIIKHFQDTLNPAQITVLVQMHEETRMLQAALIDMHKTVYKIIETTKLSGAVVQKFRGELDDLEKRHQGIDHDLVNTLKIRDEE